MYSRAADTVVAVHFCWILFLIFGAFWGVRYRGARYAHLAGLAFALFLQVAGWYCPLTHLEVWLRSLQKPHAAYSGSFIVHYLEALVYPGVPPWFISAATVALTVVNLAVYLRLARSKGRHG